MTKRTSKRVAALASSLVREPEGATPEDIRTVAASALTQTEEPDTEARAEAMANKAASLVGTLTDIPFPQWENTTPKGKDFWREIAKA